MPDEAMIDSGLHKDDWLIINCQKEVEPGTIGVVRHRGETIVRRVMKDRNGWYLRSDNTSYSIIRPEGEEEARGDRSEERR